MTDLHEVARASRLTGPLPYIHENYNQNIALSFVDPTAQLGRGTRVWHFAIVLDHVKIGSNCSIGSRAEIGAGSLIGDETRIGSGVFLPPNSTIGSHVFIGPNVTCTDDKHPRAGNSDYVAEPPIIEDGASIGAGAILLPGVKIGTNARVAAGAIVTRDVPPDGHVLGFPARERAMPVEWKVGATAA